MIYKCADIAFNHFIQTHTHTCARAPSQTYSQSSEQCVYKLKTCKTFIMNNSLAATAPIDRECRHWAKIEDKKRESETVTE